MARREEALAKEEENLQRELRETERSDNEGDEWEEPINVTPVTHDLITPPKKKMLKISEESLETLQTRPLVHPSFHP